jgi:hypothetical protein
MSRKSKVIAGVILLVCGIALIAWNLRDPDRAYREPPKEERVVTLEQTPLPVQSAIQRVSAGSKIEEIKEKRRGGPATYEVDVIRGDVKTKISFHEDGSVAKEKSKKLKPPQPGR